MVVVEASVVGTVVMPSTSVLISARSGPKVVNAKNRRATTAPAPNKTGTLRMVSAAGGSSVGSTPAAT